MLPKGPWWPGLLSGCLGGLRALKKENYRVTYGFTDLRGKPARRGRDGRGPLNQNVAGLLLCDWSMVWQYLIVMTSHCTSNRHMVTIQHAHTDRDPPFAHT
jgi:hypothetical protein